MKLWEKLPSGVNVNGKFYRMNFDFRNVIKMMEILGDDDLMPQAREYNALKCLMKHPRNVRLVLLAVKNLLFGKPTSQAEDKQKITDFTQDAPLIRAAFKQAYNIDLYRDKLHWIEFRELLNAIPGGNRYSEVIGIRVRPLPKANRYNAEERAWLIKAKADVALEMSEEEQQQRYDSDVSNLAMALKGMIKKGGGNRG